MSKKLNGIPNNLVESFFSTLKYYEVGYMTDWVVNVMKKHNIREASLDILKVKADPKQLSIRPILVNLESIQYIIKSELEVNGFATDYITEAIIKVSYDPTLSERTFYPEEWKPERAFYAHAVVTDKEGNKYEMPKKAYNSYEDFEID